MIWQYIAIAVVAFALSYTQAKKAQKQAKKAADAMKGVLVNKESNIDSIPVIYGTRRVGGTRVFVHTQGGKKNQFLYMCLALCEGEVDDIYDIKIDDYDITDSRFGAVTKKILGANLLFSDPNGLIKIEIHKGGDNQAASSVLRETNKWTSDHRLQGVAYLAIRLEWNEDVFSGIPEITAVVKGKTVDDPRTTSSAKVWTDNPALCLLDYLKNPRYGKGLPDGVIDIPSFKIAANFCDASTVRVSSDSRNTESEKIFRCNYVVDTGDKIFENVQKFLLGCRGFLPYTDGKYSLRIDQKSDPVMTIDESKIIGGIGIAGESKKERFNRVLIKFPNPKTEWQPDQAVWPDAGSDIESDYFAEDGGELLVEEIDMEMITSFYAARDFARIFLQRSRNALRVQLTATSEAMDLVPSDVVIVNHPTPGWSGASKPFQVEEMSLSFDGTVDLQLIEYDPSIYTYQAGPVEPEYPDTDLPDPFDVDPVSNISFLETTQIAADGTLLIALQVSWDESPNSFVSEYEIGWYDKATNVVFTDTLGYTSASTPSTSYLISNISERNLIVGIRAVSTVGARSEWVYKIHQPEGDSTAPDKPRSPSVNAEFGQINISWVNPTQPDFSHTIVYVKEKVEDEYTELTKVPAPANTYTHTGLLPASRRFYQLSSVDYSGNESDPVYAGADITTFIDDDDFSQGVKDLFDEAELYAIQPYPTLDDAPDDGGELGKLIYIRDVGKLYEWKGSNAGWEPLVADIADLVGTLPDTVVIGEDRITAPMIKAGEIRTYLIDAGGIKADEIDTNSLKAGLAQVSGLIADSAMIESGVITNAKIENAAVSTFKIGDNAVTIPAFEVFRQSLGDNLVLIPDKDKPTYSFSEGHPENWLTAGALEFYWGKDKDEKENEDNGYKASIPPARIAVFGDAFFGGQFNDGNKTCTTRLLVIEGSSPSFYKTREDPDTYAWDIPSFPRYENVGSLPSVASSGSKAFVAGSTRRVYLYNGSRWVVDNSYQSGQIILSERRAFAGFGSAITQPLFHKFNPNTNRFDSNGIQEIGRGETSVREEYSINCRVDGFYDTSGSFSNSVKLILQMRTDRFSGGQELKNAGRVSMLAIGTKK